MEIGFVRTWYTTSPGLTLLVIKEKHPSNVDYGVTDPYYLVDFPAILQHHRAHYPIGRSAQIFKDHSEN